ncbi:putative transcription factor MYB58 [Canna indica]|uniref:Transcription factor MYB58 n=1 Tax=Canna indica TaxID=4628 RepID=A0AAQ3QEW7_9LILI|nr:putative transcription factor MYB58 [Canna indica]
MSNRVYEKTSAMASGSSKMGKHEQGGTALRKGPWMAEEDEVLLEYVRKHGPRDWSSIRSKGLLSRTGKSCRLRWVNKLQPDLKTGCKFSPEEERVVINLQAQFGNKWARIATHLPGRTDNDVKNFWSTRQKRLARILRTPLPTKLNKSQGRLPVSSHETTSSSECLQDPCLDLLLSEEDSSKGQFSWTTSYAAHEDARELDRLPDLVSCRCLQNVDTPLHLLKPAMDTETNCLMMNNPMPLELPFESLPLLSFPIEPEATNHLPGHGGLCFPAEFTCHEPLPSILPEELPFFGLEAGLHGIRREEERPATPGSFLDEFPSEMFDYLEPPTTTTRSPNFSC